MTDTREQELVDAAKDIAVELKTIRELLDKLVNPPPKPPPKGGMVPIKR